MAGDPLNAPKVLSEPSFRAMWLARVTSGIGTAFATVALAFGVLESGGTVFTLGLILSAGAAARLLFLLAGGVWADRLPRKRVMIATDLVRMLAQAAIAVLLILHIARAWEFLAANVIVSAASSFFFPAAVALTADVISPERLQEGNAFLSMSDNGTELLGPALSGLLIAAVGVGWSFAVDAASFAGSAAFMLAIPAMRHAPDGDHRSFVAELAEGWREVTARRWFWLNLISHGSWNLALTTFFVLGPAIALRHFGGSVGWGLLCAGLSAGAIVGALILLRVHPQRPLVRGNQALVLGALPLLSLAVGAPLYVAIIAAAACYAGMTFLNGVWNTSVQQLVAPGLLARVISYDYLISYAVQPVGYALAGIAAKVASVDTTLIFAAALMIAPSLAVSLLPAVRAVVRQGDVTVCATSSNGSAAV